jgi:glycosyltransferase involved in cell wall biosynthesis
MKKKMVSVIMSIYNEEIDWIIFSIDSIINQSYKEIEYIIICDDPQNLELINFVGNYIKKDDRIRMFINNQNIGLAMSLNRAIEYSKGFYIARMDADDISRFDRIEIQVKFLEENKEIGLLSSNRIVIDEKGYEISRGALFPENSAFIEHAINYLNFFTHSSWMVRKEVYDELGGYKDYAAAQDYDFLLRAQTFNIKMAFQNEYLLYYRIRENSISSSKLLYRIKLEISLKKKGIIKQKIKYFKSNSIIEDYFFDLSQKYFEKFKLLYNKRYKIGYIYYFLLSIFISKYQFYRIKNIIIFKLIVKHYKRNHNF